MKNRKKLISLFLVLALIMTSIMPLKNVSADDDFVEVDAKLVIGQKEAREMLDLINNLRKTEPDTNSTEEYVVDYTLQCAAMQRAAEIAYYFEDIRPDGSEFTTALTDLGFVFSGRGPLVGQNLAAGEGEKMTASGAIQEWCTYELTRRNLLGNYAAVGIGHVMVDDGDYWVIIFSTKLNNAYEIPDYDYEDSVKIKFKKEMLYDAQLVSSTNNLTVAAGESIALPAFSGEIKVHGRFMDKPLIATGLSSFTGDGVYVSVSDGKIYGLSEGTGRITANIGGTILACNVTVTAGNGNNNPVTVSPDPTNPVTVSPDPTNPVTTSPAPTNPVTTSPAPTNPVTTSPAPTNPVTTSPAPTNPVTTSPAPTNPVTTSPAPTNPVTTSPAPTNPVTTSPAPTNPVTATPTPNNTVTPTPTTENTVTPTPTPGNTVTPTTAPYNTVTPTPTATPTATPTPTKENGSESGIIEDDSVKFIYKENKYKIISNSTVSLVSTLNTKATKLSVPSTVKYKGKTYKVTKIEANALSGLKKLTSLTLGKNIKKIGKKAFYGCSLLEKITIKSTKISSFGKVAFGDISQNAVITVNKSVKTKYEKKIKSSGIGSKVKISTKGAK